MSAASDPVPPSVRVVDLRASTPVEALGRVKDLLDDPSGSDLRRLVVLDTAAALIHHDEAYQALVGSRRMDSMLCVAVGPRRDPDDPAEHRLKVPATIGAGMESAVIWAGDPDGVEWRPSPSAAAVTRATGAYQPGLQQLVKLLEVPEIYERARSLAAQVNGGVVSPGLPLADEDADHSVGLFALTSVLTQITGRAISNPQPTPETRTLAHRILTVDGAEDLRWEEVARPDGPLARAAAGARAALHEAGEARAAVRLPSLLISGPALVRAAAETATQAGQRLIQLRGQVEQLARVQPDVGAQVAAAGQAGVRIPQRQLSGDQELGTLLGRTVDELLQGGATLNEVSAQLSVLESNLRPATAGQYLEQLRQHCPDELPGRLARPVPYPSPQPWLPAAGLLVGLLAAIGGSSWVVPAVVVALLWCAGAFVATGAPDQTLPRRAGLPLAAGMAAAVGIGAAVAAGGRIADSVGDGPDAVMGLAGLVLAALAIPVLLSLSWSGRSRAWSARVPVPQGAQVVDGIQGVALTIVDSWSRTATRNEAADAITRAQAALEGVRAGFGTQQAAPRRLRAEQPGLIAYCQRVLRSQVGDLALRVLRPRWPDLAAFTPREHEQATREEVEIKLRRWRDRLDSDDPFGPLDFTVAPEPLADPPDPEVRAHLQRTAGASVTGEMWQLTAPGDNALLDLDPDRVLALRYTSALFRRTSGGLLPDDVIWCEGSLRSGALRLIPVQPRHVLHTWGSA